MVVMGRVSKHVFLVVMGRVGKQVHVDIISERFESNLSTRNACVNIYVKHKRIDHTCQVFERMEKQDVVSWTAMIERWVENGISEDF